MSHAAIREAGTSALYRAVWRWHFYAGLIVLPFVILIAITGAIYLFKDEYTLAAQSDLRIVAPRDSAQRPPSAITAAALEAHPGTLKVYTPAAGPDRAAEVRITREDGTRDIVFVNPYDATVLGTAWDAGASGSPAMHVVRKLHSLEYVGWWGNRIIEAVAGWMVLLVATGIYLWWPRGRNVGVVAPRRTTGRPWWRDIHAVTGLYTAGFIVFLALTGLPWSGIWGSKFYDLSYAAGIGMPDGYWSDYPTSTVPTGEALDRSPWILEKQPMPVSGASRGVPAAIDAVVAIVEDAGIHPGYALDMPSGPTGVFTASVYPHDIGQERVIHLDQYTGEILFDMGIDDLGALGWAAEWGVAIHMGQAFGVANQVVLAVACLAMVLLSVSAVVMWWKRRPARGLGAPTVPADWRIPRGILVIAVAAGVFFPLVGLSLLVVAAIELALFGARRLRAA
ncbi:PepSY-associated TM helix domain-containing protein [Roseivivax isoporae]|uniref:Propeptide, pepSY amd peptidase M4 n=1 Tax=Roseivivax isoporae LMG 25204 TaxID=1449351 RepID=X7F4N9_9RHOB|nr:PepSY domain-containing protein [Roseivivax isoporae]ETX27708.1 propeptide, pepSY amd peptidase M4 [Roseivivax isoporae LMG 25204]